MSLTPLFVGDVAEWVIDNPETGWILVLLYLVWEIRGPGGRIQNIISMIRANTIVVRAIARTNDHIDTDTAEEFLTDNGHEPGDFINMRSQSRLREDDGDETKEEDDENEEQKG